MATAKAINVRRQDAIQRITKALGVDIARSNKDSALAEAMTLEAIADAVESAEAPATDETETAADAKPTSRSRKAAK